MTAPELPVDPSDSKAQWVRQAPENSIYLMGQVAIPGRYYFNDKFGFLDIITASDGPTPAADLRNIRVAKGGQRGSNVVQVNLKRCFQTSDESLLPRVRPGDVIYVPSLQRDNVDLPSSQTVRLLGAVGKPGRYRFNDSLTLLDLLANAAPEGGRDGRPRRAAADRPLTQGSQRLAHVSHAKSDWPPRHCIAMVRQNV